MRIMIGECLVKAGHIDVQDLEAALAEHRRSGERLGAVMVRLGLASETQVTQALGYQLGFPYVNPAEEPPEPAAIVLIPKNVALERICIALKRRQEELTVAMADPLVFNVVQDLEFRTGYHVRQVIAKKADILAAIYAGYPDKALAPVGDDVGWSTVMSRAPGGDDVPGALTPADDDALFERDGGDDGREKQAPIIDLVDRIVNRAVKGRASDIHVEPTEDRVVVRHRLDGILREVIALPKWVHDGLVARLKVLAGMDIAEKRLPQDGRLRVQVDNNRDVDLRVSTLRTMYGEKIESPDIKVGRSQRTGSTCAVSPAHLSSSNNHRLNTLRRLLAAAEQAPQPERGLRRRPSTEARKYCSGRSQKNP